MRRWIVAYGFAATLAIVVADAAPSSRGPTQRELNDAVNDSANWVYADHDYVRAFDARTGRVLWTWNVDGPLAAVS